MSERSLTDAQIDNIAEKAARRAIDHPANDDHPLTDAQIDVIAETAARKALQIVYAEVGQSVLKKLAWIVGIVVIGLAIWLAGKNSLPTGHP